MLTGFAHKVLTNLVVALPNLAFKFVNILVNFLAQCVQLADTTGLPLKVFVLVLQESLVHEIFKLHTCISLKIYLLGSLLQIWSCSSL